MADYTEQLKPIKNWVSDITNAIREKDGSTGAIKHIDIPDRILSIPTITEENIQQIEKNTKEIEDARVGYFGKSYDTIEERIDGDINNVLNKVDVVNYKDTTIHATNTYARNLTANGNKVEILGQTIQNCLDHSSIDKFSSLPGIIDEDGYINIEANGDWRIFATKPSSAILKPNTTYTIILDVKETSLQFTGDGSNAIHIGDTNPSSFSTYFSSIVYFYAKVGIQKKIIKTKSNFENIVFADRGQIANAALSGSIKFRYMVVEGDWTNKDISFVPFGLNTPSITEIKMFGANCLENNKISSFSRLSGTIDEDGYINIEANGDWRFFATKPSSAILKPNTIYTIILEVKENTLQYSDASGYMQFGETNPSEPSCFNNAIFFTPTAGIHKKTITTKENFTSVMFADRGQLSNQIISGYIKFKYAVVEGDYTDKEISTIDYISNSMLISEDLMKINDNYCDKVYMAGGKMFIEKKTGRVLISENNINYMQITVLNNVIRAGIVVNNVSGYSNSLVLCNLFNSNGEYELDEEHIYLGGSENRFEVFISKEKISSFDETGVREYIKNNNIDVIYRLPNTNIKELKDIDDFYSYEGQTNWQTTNVIKPTLNVDIPSNLNAVVSTLMTENSTLKNENKVLSAELELTNNAVEQQQADIDYISMMTEVQL